jgi:hypothetical protein
MAATPATTSSRFQGVGPLWILANAAAGAIAGLFFLDGSLPTRSQLIENGFLAGVLVLSLWLCGRWLITGLVFGFVQWLVLRRSIRLGASWLFVSPLAGLGFMAAQFVIPIFASWLIGPASVVLAAAIAGWIVGALQWMLMGDPDVSANRWVIATAMGTGAASLVWNPAFPWALTTISPVVASLVAGVVYAMPAALMVMRNVPTARTEDLIAQSADRRSSVSAQV